MSEPTIFGLFSGTVGFAVFVIAAWKIASWLARKGHVVRPATWMDHQMTKIENVAAEKKRAAETFDRD
ncbi:hypothetical protein EGY25_14080 [Brevundimonas intermedia]|uniref:Uncharacterized protein n=1 Tax=Brevundimonas intermedia TaxID=74315 RepID=A0A4Y9RP60_9CAUL|nr:hypothetical protein [Brevundimonas intermedia]TFW10840.1 hypothetical protein EGY25_14080 [Brevundimonas intermedia]